MAQITTGIRKILEIPFFYTTFQNMLGAKRSRKEIVDRYLDIKPEMSILDVGCGPGDLFPFFPKGVDYHGFDFEKSYIDKAIKKFGGNGNFICDDVTTFSFGEKKFDRVIITGVLHHLEDSQIDTLFSKLSLILKSDGFLICVENVFIPNQNKVAKYLISKDRGQNVRSDEGYIKLARKFFKNTNFEIRHNMLNIPYTHIILKLN